MAKAEQHQCDREDQEVFGPLLWWNRKSHRNRSSRSSSHHGLMDNNLLIANMSSQQVKSEHIK